MALAPLFVTDSAGSLAATIDLPVHHSRAVIDTRCHFERGLRPRPCNLETRKGWNVLKNEVIYLSFLLAIFWVALRLNYFREDTVVLL